MSKRFSLATLIEYLDGQVKQLGDVSDELKEIQVGFNSAFVEWKAEHDAALERLTETIFGDFESISPELNQLISDRRIEEQQILADRSLELKNKLIPETQQSADDALAEGQKLTANLRESNPRLDRREEKIKAKREELEHRLEELNQQIKKMSGVFGVFFNFFKIGKVDKERQQVIGQLKVVQQDLKEVREEWDSLQKETSRGQEDYQQLWQEYTLELARLQSEYDFLDDPANAEELIQKRAIRHVIDNLKTKTPAGIADMQVVLDDMVQFNVQTDTYHEGLGSVGGLIAMMDGLSEGIKRFRESVKGLLDQQEMHSAYLPKLKIDVGDRVIAFFEQLDGIRTQVEDDAHISMHPNQFIKAVEPAIAASLSNEAIESVFNSLGDSLTRATKEWD